jgi:hypothetical protein
VLRPLKAGTYRHGYCALLLDHHRAVERAARLVEYHSLIAREIDVLVRALP